jgi:hypothetical protein
MLMVSDPGPVATVAAADADRWAPDPLKFIEYVDDV